MRAPVRRASVRHAAVPAGAGVIITVTLNAAVDVTYQVERFVPGSAMRVAHVHERAGGKGIDVARVLAAIGAPVCATGLAGGRRGRRSGRNWPASASARSSK